MVHRAFALSLILVFSVSPLSSGPAAAPASPEPYRASGPVSSVEPQPLPGEGQQILPAAAAGYAWLALGDGTNGMINSLEAVDTGNLYAGGHFTTAGGINAQVARWNGTSWTAVGSSMAGYDVWALTTDDNDSLYAAFFSNAGQVLSSRISKWNGKSWTTLGEVNDGIVWTLAADSAGNLYAGGEFAQVGAASASNIARWNGANWSGLGSGTDSAVLALTVDASGNLYAGGKFSQAGGKPINYLAKWNGSNWSALGSGPSPGSVSSLAADQNGNLYAVHGGVSVWDGSTWESLGFLGGAYQIALDENGAVYASVYDFTVDGVGSFYSVQTWTGSSWQTLGRCIGYLGPIEYQGHRLYAGGSFESMEGVSANNVAMLVPNHFADVQPDHWAHIYIERLFAARITGGCGTNPLRYCPDDSVTRDQMAVFLLRGIHDSSYIPPAVGSSTGFLDVATDHWAAAWIKQLAAEKITGGCGAGNYCPGDPVTRAQIAVFLLKAKHGSAYQPPAVGSSTGFSDVPTNYWAAAWIKQLAAEGITGGCAVNLYCPDVPVTRAQMAVFLVKAFNLP